MMPIGCHPSTKLNSAQTLKENSVFLQNVLAIFLVGFHIIFVVLLLEKGT